jgi:LEA14-like dessication related protein
MSRKDLVLLRSLLLLAAAAVTLASCAWMHGREPPQVSLAGVEPSPAGDSSGSQSFEARVQLKLRVRNPNDTAIDYNGISVELDVQGKSLASGLSNQSGTVPPFGETLISVPVTVSMWGMANQALGLLSGKSMSTITYEMRGKLNDTRNGMLAFKSQGTLNLADLVGGGG